MDNDDIAPDTNYAENSNIRSVSSISNAVDGRSRTRKPFHFKTTIHNQTAGCSSSPEVVPNDEAQEATYFRYKYYQRLRGNQQTDEALLIPDHVVPRIFFYPYIPGTAARTGKQSSLITIFAIWNTMMGTSLLAMPWAIERAGLVAGLLLILIMASICLYTAYRNLQVFTLYGEKENLDDFPDLCAFLLGRTGQIVSVLFSALSLLGACVVYWVLMSNFLYNTVKYFFEFSSATETFGREGNGTFDLVCPGAENETVALDAFAVPTAFDNFWDLNLTVPLYLMAILLPLMCLKSATFFTKFNALGTLSVFYIVSFVSIKAGQWGWNVEVEDASSPLYIPFVRPSFPALSGMLSLALFLHNCVVAIMKNNRRPENNVNLFERRRWVSTGLWERGTASFQSMSTVDILTLPGIQILSHSWNC